ncbi:MAG: hypothetical protein ACR2I0_14975, partial [Rhodoferax sp.]
MTADLNLASSLTTANPFAAPAPAAGMDPAGRPAGGDAAPGSTDFAELLTGHMLKMERQNLAAGSPTGPIAGAGLQVLPLGSQLKVITSDAPMPDLASVAAFARAQGLGDAAVRALFGVLPPAAPAVGTVTSGELSGLPDSAPSGRASNNAKARADSTLLQEASPDAIGSDTMAQISTAAMLQARWSAPPAAPLPPPTATRPGASAPQTASAIAAPLALMPGPLGTSTAPGDVVRTGPPRPVASERSQSAPILAAPTGTDPVVGVTVEGEAPGQALVPNRPRPAVDLALAAGMAPAAPQPAAQALTVTAGAPTAANPDDPVVSRSAIAGSASAILALQIDTRRPPTGAAEADLPLTPGAAASAPTALEELLSGQAMAHSEFGKALLPGLKSGKPGLASSATAKLERDSADKAATAPSQDLTLELPANWSVDSQGNLLVDARQASSPGPTDAST